MAEAVSCVAEAEEAARMICALRFADLGGRPRRGASPSRTRIRPRRPRRRSGGGGGGGGGDAAAGGAAVAPRRAGEALAEVVRGLDPPRAEGPVVVGGGGRAGEADAREPRVAPRLQRRLRRVH
uniref:Uncharacterized protein n=1 Tax=Ananas comosus var. bracteatus TaxID=296719 RepID=A0A6V7PM68_ANACO|nr:unnamed protein product [Ananas comosus var. bracteatus]